MTIFRTILPTAIAVLASITFPKAAMLALIGAAIARRKGRDFGGWWAYGVLLNPVALIHAIALRKVIRKCPFCGKRINPNAGIAMVCRHCGRDVPKVVLPAPISD